MPLQADDRVYFESRAEHELAMAASAANSEAANAHSILAQLYLDRLRSLAEPALAERVLT